MQPDEKSLLETPPITTLESPESPTAEVNQNWVIFTKEQAKEMGVASWLAVSDRFWTPSADDILTLEDRLGEYLLQNSDQFYRQPPVWEQLDKYQRQ